MASIGPYDLCLSPRVTKGQKQKEISLFVSETTVSTTIISIIIDIIMNIYQQKMRKVSNKLYLHDEMFVYVM